MFAPGAMLAGKYRVDRVLGQGGMGVVVAATHVHLHQQVAIKLLLPEMMVHQQLLERFLREARASAALHGEHVCRVSDVGTLETGAPYIVMELLAGRDLASVVANDGPLPLQTAVDYVLQGLLGLAEAHALGIVHRDLKPANLFLTKRPDGTPLIKVLDFGIAKAQNDQRLDLTRTAAVMGSPGYMSPEQLRSTKDVDARSDIWSIGVILFELVSGRPPFQGESITELALHIAMDPTPPLPAALPAGFDQVVYCCLEKDPAHRFADVASLAHALAPFGGPRAHEMAGGVARVLNVEPRLPGRIATPPHGVPVARPTTLQGAATGGPVPEPPPRSRFAWIAGGVVVAALAAVGIVLATRGESGTSAASGTHPPSAATAPSEAAPPSTGAAPSAATASVPSTATQSPAAVTAAPDAAVPGAESAGVDTAVAPTTSPSSAAPRATEAAPPVARTPVRGKRNTPAPKPSAKTTSSKPATSTPSSPASTPSKPAQEEFGDSRY